MARSVLKTMPGRFALAALSMGGYVAFEVMRQAPERVTRLALLDCNTEMAAGIADSRLVVCEDCGHLAPMERPDEVTAAPKDWLG